MNSYEIFGKLDIKMFQSHGKKYTCVRLWVETQAEQKAIYKTQFYTITLYYDGLTFYGAILMLEGSWWNKSLPTQNILPTQDEEED